MERLRILASAAALGDFTVRELCAFSGANEETVRSVLRREPGRFTAIGQEHGGVGRPTTRWTVTDLESVRAELAELEQALGPLRPQPSQDPPPDADRLDAVIAAEDALLRAWQPDEAQDAEALAYAALLSLEQAKTSADREDFIDHRAQSVAAFARLVHADARGVTIGADALLHAARALVDLSELAPERVPGFIRGLSEIASRMSAVLPVGLITHRDVTPGEAIHGLSETHEWISHPLPGSDELVWAQSWAEPLLDPGLVPGVVIHDDGHGLKESLQQAAGWRRPTVVVSESESIERVNEVSQNGAYFLSSSAGANGVAETISSALDREQRADVATGPIVASSSS